MPETAPRISLKKQLTLPRSFSRVLGRLIALPAPEGLHLAKSAYHKATHPTQRVLAMRLRLRLLQEAKEAKAAPTPEPEPEPEVTEEPIPSIEPVKPRKEAKLVSMDPASAALSDMMSELGGSGEADDFFNDD